MKKSVLILILLLIPLAKATIILEDFEREKHNVGDKILISGYILEDKPIWGKFQLDLTCNEVDTLLVKIFNIKKGEKFDFSEELPLFFSTGKDCKIVASLSDKGTIIDQTQSEIFEISNELLGDFKIKNNFIQLGKKVEIEGTIKKLSGELVNGVATVFFIQNNEIFSVDTVEVNEGSFSYSYDTTSSFSGEYLVNVEIIETFGNRYLFENLLKFTLVNELAVVADVNKESALPGAVIKVFGEADTILQEGAGKGSVTINFNGEQYNMDFYNGKFDYNLQISDDIKSGKQEINIVMVDSFGNKGEAQTSVDIIPIPSNLDVEFDKKTYLPKETIKFKPLLYDQAGDLINEIIVVDILTPENDVVEAKKVNSNSEAEFTFSESASPGTWKLRLSNTNLEEDKEFIVGNLALLDYSIEDSVLIARNVGNIKYVDPIEIKIKGNNVDLSLTKKTSINPGKTLKVNLGREVATGTYDVIADDKKFDSVEITGKSKILNLSNLYWVLFYLLVVLVGYVIFFRSKRKILKKLRERRLKNKKNPDNYMKKTRNIMIKKAEERDRKIRSSLNIRFKEERGREGFRILGKEHINKPKEPETRKDDEKKDGGLFNMFD